MRKYISILMIIMLTAVFSCTAKAYSDVSEKDWYYENIELMSDKGILKGYDDNTFRPESEITYAEFVSVIARYYTSNIHGNSHWADGAMQYAYENQWYDYDEINAQLYDSAIPRYMAVKLAVLAFDLPKTENDDGVYWRYMNEIKDFGSIDGRYAYLVVRAYHNGMLTGDENGNFNPRAPLTRAEACAIISRAAGMTVIPEPPTPAPEENAASVRGGVKENGSLRVIGTQLCNKDGEAINLRGMSTHGLQWYGSFAERGSVHAVAEAGTSVMRFAVYTGEGGYLSDKEKMKKTLYNGVDNAVAEDLYAIIDWHILSDGNPMTSIDAAMEFFEEVSKKYADCDNVIYEICNEPNGNVTWSGDVKPYAERVIPVIRKNAPDSVILVGSPTWSQDVDKAADDPLSFENVMYTCHFYAGTHGEWLRDKIKYAISKGAPVFISEWGTSAADGNGGVYLQESQQWLEFLNAHNISWVNWSLCDKQESSAAIKAGTGNEFNMDDLTESGRFVFSNFK